MYFQLDIDDMESSKRRPLFISLIGKDRPNNFDYQRDI